MTNELDELFERAKNVRMGDEERERQRRSFAYGNAKIENDHVTRELVDQEAERLKSDD